MEIVVKVWRKNSLLLVVQEDGRQILACRVGKEKSHACRGALLYIVCTL